MSEFNQTAGGDNIFRGNTILANALNGILDNTIHSNTNAYYNNLAKNNGNNPAKNVNPANRDTNFTGGVLETTGAPIRLWQLPAVPSNQNNLLQAGQTLDNISIS